MEALVCVRPGELRLERRSPPKADLSRLLVRPRRVGVCGTDYHIFEGKHPYLQYPRVMGHELAVELVDAPAGLQLPAGQIFAVNPYVSCGGCIACRRGKPNCCTTLSVLGVHEDGGMAGLLALPAANLIPVDGLSMDQAATVEFLAIGAHAVRRAALSREDRALVVGAGPIGLAVALFAIQSGASVTILDRDAERAASAESITGANTLVADEAGLAELAGSTSNEGFDVVFDATGSPAAMEKSFDHVAHGGRYVLVGVVREAITFQDPDFHRKEMTLLGSRNATAEDFGQVVAAIRGGLVPVDRLITHRTSLPNAVFDLPRWASQKRGLIKAVIEIGA